ncbi:class I SAM-dependent methyltransferase [soil metagenome]
MHTQKRAEQDALLELLRALKARNYRWITPTPETQRRVLERPGHQSGVSLPDIFGWSLPFAPHVLAPDLLALMQSAGIVVPCGNLLASTLRVSSLGDELFLHSAYPTVAEDSVFFGPDTYRFARFIAQCAAPARRLVDVGCGSGAGAIVAARASGASEVIMADINPAALRLAFINASAAGVVAEVATSDVLQGLGGQFDLVVANPPYLVDDDKRIYRHGGDLMGAGLSLRIAREAAARLNPGGRLLLYTASAIVEGIDPFAAAVIPMLRASHCSVIYEEIDPDVFGEELDRPAYRHVDRVAVVGVVAEKRIPQ